MKSVITIPLLYPITFQQQTKNKATIQTLLCSERSPQDPVVTTVHDQHVSSVPFTICHRSLPACHPPITCRGCCCCAQSLNTSSIEPSSTGSVKPALFFLCQSPQVWFFHLAFLSWRCWNPHPISSFLQPAKGTSCVCWLLGGEEQAAAEVSCYMAAALWMQNVQGNSLGVLPAERGEHLHETGGCALCSACPVS